MCDMSLDPTEKRSARINFRAPEAVVSWIDGLVEETGWSVADICITGLCAHRADIEAMVRMGGPRPPADVSQLREIVHLVRQAQLRGVDLRATLTAALEAQLATQPAA